PRHHQSVQPGRIYVAPPDYHLLLNNSHIHLARGPRENRHRPAADALFRTAARAYGRRVIGVVLSGALDDGTAGLAAIKQRGGRAIVQDPDDALYPSMPTNALENVPVDPRVPVAQMGALLSRLVHEPIPPARAPTVSNEMEQEADMAELDVEAMQDPHRVGVP